MKKFLLTVFSAIVFLMAVSAPVSAATDSGSATVSPAVGAAGETVKVTVSLKDVAPANVVGVAFSYDDELVLNPEKSKWLLSDGVIVDIDGAKKQAAWTTEQVKDVNGNILELAFIIPEDAGLDASYDVTCTVMVQNGNSVLATFEAVIGEITTACKHSLKEHAATEPTCKSTGNKQYWTCEKCPAVFKADKKTETTVAAETLAKVGHAGGTATCTAKAVCKWCNTSYGELLAHKSTELKAKEATCTATGLTAGKKCSVCNTVLEKQTTVPKKAHTEKVIAAVAPTCTATGLTAGKKCSVCNTVLEAQKKVAATGHTWGEWVVTKKATTKEYGEQTRTCSICKTVEKQRIDKIPAATAFVDVPADAYFAEPVSWAVAKGITMGTTTTTFAPDDTCTRGQIVTFLWRAAGCPEPKSTMCPFTDILTTDYYYKAVLWAVESGITQGTSATTFAPAAPCTRGQVATFLWRAQGEPKPAGTKMPFGDVEAGAYYYNAIIWAVENGVTQGTSATTFAPDAPCTRGQIVTFLYRAMY